jgi:hypothetical protein
VLEPDNLGNPCDPETGKEEGAKLRSSNDDKECIECTNRLSVGMSKEPGTWAVVPSRTEDNGLLVEPKPAKGELGFPEERRDVPGMDILVDALVEPRP